MSYFSYLFLFLSIFSCSTIFSFDSFSSNNVLHCFEEITKGTLSVCFLPFLMGVSGQINTTERDEFVLLSICSRSEAIVMSFLFLFEWRTYGHYASIVEGFDLVEYFGFVMNCSLAVTHDCCLE